MEWTCGVWDGATLQRVCVHAKELSQYVCIQPCTRVTWFRLGLGEERGLIYLHLCHVEIKGATTCFHWG